MAKTFQGQSFVRGDGSRTVIVTGVPGSGKTTWGVNKLRELLKDGIAPQEILVASFSRAAAEEFMSRACRDTGISDPDMFPYIGTIHGICYRLLGLTKENVWNEETDVDFSLERGWELTERRTACIWATGDNYVKDNFKLSTPSDWVFAAYRWCRRMNAELSDYLHEERPMYPTHISNNYARFVSDMAKFKMKHSIMDFDDMLMRVLQENRVPPVRYILIDECQDLSTLQLKVVRAWSADRQSDLYMMGDDDQSLYSFLGADARWMKELSDTPGCETIRLQTTYRFGQHIANRANAIIEPVADRVVKSIVSQSSGGTYRDRVSYESMLADISLRAHGTESCMILTVNNHYADSVREELMQRGIPYANTAGGYAPLESPNAQLYAALAAPREYWTPQEIRGLTTLAVPANDFFLSRGNKAQCERLIEQGWKSGEQVSMTDLYNMGFRISIVERLVKGDMTLLRRLSEADKRYYELVMEHYGLNSLTDPPAVSVGTIHSVKGKESDYVYVLTDCLLKSYKGFKKEGSSERRLAYVAITRCRLGCAIVRPEWSRYRLQV